MRFFYIANDNFSGVGHPAHTLRSLCAGDEAQVVLITCPQAEGFGATLPDNCRHVECLPDQDAGRYCAPHRFGAIISRALLEEGIESDDVIVLKMPFPYLLLAVVYAIALTRVSTKRPRVSVLISQTDEGYAYESIKYSDCFMVIERLPAAYRDSFILLNEREVLRRHWLALFPALRTGLCGYVTEWFEPASSVVASNGKAVLTYLGEARAEKGFETTAAVIGSGALDCPMRIHRDANENNMGESYASAIGLLEARAAVATDIELVHQMRDDCYPDAFQPGAVALMLYSPEYRLRGSGVLQECAAAGMYVIAYEDLSFHLDFPDNVLTVNRTDDVEALGREIQHHMDGVAQRRLPPLKPNVLLASDFRQRLVEHHAAAASDDSANEFVFVVTNNVHQQGCSKIIGAQQDEICDRGLTPVFISFEWPNLDIDWKESVAFERIWDGQMNSPDASYGAHYLTIPLVTRSRVLERYDSFQYKELVEISRDVDADILDDYLAWRSAPTVVLNYIHHAPILDGKLSSEENVFVEIHDITSVQQRIRTRDETGSRFEENMALEINDLSRFKHTFSLSVNEVELLAARGCAMNEHSYLDVFLRQAKAWQKPAESVRVANHGVFDGEYLCIVASNHPSNVMEINRFCEHELANQARTIPIAVCGLVCDHIKVSTEQLERAGIFLIGFVDDVAPIIRGALATLNPVDIGSGTPIKVLDSIANETPCLVTRRTLVAMPTHPLVSEFDFCHQWISDDAVRSLAAKMHAENAGTPSTQSIRPNRLGVFLDERHPC